MNQPGGILLLDKESGITSHDAVARLRRALGIRKVGHSGTLDPMATGLLILCIGSATRLQSIFMDQLKTYEAEVTFGWATDTQDAVGEPLSEPEPVNVTAEEIRKVLPRFRGEIEQIPPSYSAKKVQGRRAYQLAREGEKPHLEPRNVRVEWFELLGCSDDGTARFVVTCSAGTYVRTLAHDLGETLGVGAHLSELRRTAIGDYRVEDAFPTTRLEHASKEEILSEPHFRGMKLQLPFESVMIDRAQAERIARGQEIVANCDSGTIEEGDRTGLVVPDGTLVAVAEVIRVIRRKGPIALQPRIVLVS